MERALMGLVKRIAAAASRHRLAAWVGLLLAAPLVVAPPALGASASSDQRFSEPGGAPYQQVVFAAASGEVNRLAATLAPALLSLTDPVGITPLGGCARPLPSDVTRVTCRIGAVTSFQAILADKDDVLSANLAVLARGGSGADILRAGGSLYGESGDDALFGREIEDSLNGGSGRDRLSGAGDADSLSGGSGADVVRGGRGEDVLRGGGGRDALNGGRGFDQFYGDAARDRLNARDGHPDIVHCRRGDRARLDRLDMLRGRCGRVARRGAARAVPVGDLSSTPLSFAVTSEDVGDHLGTGVGCPADRTTACRGSLVIRDGRHVFGRKRFRRLAPGRMRQLTLNVGERAVNRAQSGDSRVTLVVTTRSRGRVLRAVAVAEVL